MTNTVTEEAKLSRDGDFFAVKSGTTPCETWSCGEKAIEVFG